MEVTNVDIRLYENKNTRGFLTITLSDGGEEVMVLKDWVLVQGSEGMFAASPSKQYDGKWYNQTIVLGQWRDAINSAAIAAYNRAKGGGASTGASQSAQGAGARNKARGPSAPF